MFIKALKLQYEAEIEKAKDNIKVYLVIQWESVSILILLVQSTVKWK